MRRILKILAVVILLLAAAVTVVYFAFPQMLVSMTQSQAASAAELEAKTVQVDGQTVHYYDGGNPDGAVLVLLHGMGDEKNSFVASAKQLSKTHRLILPDLMGHGENARDPDRDYSIAGQVTFLHAFLDKLGVDKFALGGNSMGGHISAAYAIKYPDQVARLILINAPGLKLDDHVVYIGFGDEIKTDEDFNKIMDRVFYNRPDIPGPVVDLMIEQTNDSIPFIDEMARQIRDGDSFALNDEIARIKAPTLILWGKHDVVVKFNVAETYNRDIAGSKLVVLENTAHSPQLEVPEVVGKEIASFLDK